MIRSGDKAKDADSGVSLQLEIQLSVVSLLQELSEISKFQWPAKVGRNVVDDS
jgi:hypothetical protein